MLRGQRLKSFLASLPEEFAKDINVPSKIRQLGVFDFKAFLNMAMLLSESEKARALRQLMLSRFEDSSWWMSRRRRDER